MKKIFASIRNNVIEKQSQIISENRSISETDLQKVPKLIANYLRIAGVLEKPIEWNADIEWAESSLILKIGDKPRAMTTQHFISNNPVTRLMYMKIQGMQFTGIDVYHNGKGKMKGKLFGLFNIINSEGINMDISELITIFSEFSILNSFFLSQNIYYEEIDKNSIKAIFTDNDIKVSGIFTFDDQGLISKFETNERFRDIGNGESELTPFQVNIKSYGLQNNYLIPKEVSASWIIDNKEFEYFKGKINNIIYNQIK